MSTGFSGSATPGSSNGFLVGGILQFRCGILQDQGMLNEGRLGIHPCCYPNRHYHRPDHSRPVPLLKCHPNAGRNQQTSVHCRHIDPFHHTWRVHQRVV